MYEYALYQWKGETVGKSNYLVSLVFQLLLYEQLISSFLCYDNTHILFMIINVYKYHINMLNVSEKQDKVDNQLFDCRYQSSWQKLQFSSYSFVTRQIGVLSFPHSIDDKTPSSCKKFCNTFLISKRSISVRVSSQLL